MNWMHNLPSYMYWVVWRKSLFCSWEGPNAKFCNFSNGDVKWLLLFICKASCGCESKTFIKPLYTCDWGDSNTYLLPLSRNAKASYEFSHLNATAMLGPNVPAYPSAFSLHWSGRKILAISQLWFFFQLLQALLLAALNIRRRIIISNQPRL